MPIYDFACKCGRKDEVLRPMELASEPIPCECGGEMCRVYVMPHVAFGYWKPQSNECTPENALAEARLAGFEDGDE